MPKPRGREHTTLTETAQQVVRELERIPGIKMIAPGEITRSRRGAGKRFITAVFTAAGFELIISGQSTQKVAVHTQNARSIWQQLQASKKLWEFTWKERERKPGV